MRVLLFVLEEGIGRERRGAPISTLGQIATHWNMRQNEVSEGMKFCAKYQLLKKERIKGAGFLLTINLPSKWTVGFRGGEAGDAELRRVENELNCLAEQLHLDGLFEIDEALAEQIMGSLPRFRKNRKPVRISEKPQTLEAPVKSGQSEVSSDEFRKNRNLPLKDSESYKPLSLKLRAAERFSEWLADIEDGPEPRAAEAMKQIIGPEFMEPRPGRYGDGGKWRMRWREDKAKVHDVFTRLVSRIKAGEVRSTPAQCAEWLWQDTGGAV